MSKLISLVKGGTEMAKYSNPNEVEIWIGDNISEMQYLVSYDVPNFDWTFLNFILTMFEEIFKAGQKDTAEEILIRLESFKSMP
jgi:hypothetical protein